MMNKKIIKTVPCILMMTFLGCVEYAPLDLRFSEPKLVVDAVISDHKEFSTITLGWNFAVGTDCGSLYTRDNIDNCKADTTASNPEVTGHVTISEEEGFQYNYAFKMKERKGYFKLPLTDNMVGTPGKKYTLDIDVTYKGKTETYHAETAMLETPVITSIDYQIRKGEIEQPEDFVPLISFHEPQGERNYYLFKLCANLHKPAPSSYCAGSSRVWNHSVLSDTFLPEEIINLSMDDGATVAKYANFYPHASRGEEVEVQMFSVDEITYKFYKSLLSQFNNDGGAYYPSPSSPPGNISNGAIGLFRATQLSYARVLYK